MKQPRRLADFGNLSEAEAKVLAGLDEPGVTVLGDGEVPSETAGPDRRVRASFVRWCALGAGDGRRLHENGLRVAGALVANDDLGGLTDGLDLEGCRLPGDLALLCCRFEAPPLLRSARARSIYLNGSETPGLVADRLQAESGVFLRDVTATGEVRLLGAKIGGNLDCDGGRFTNEGRPALNTDGAETTGGVFLRDVTATGEVRLLGVKIGGNLECVGGRFTNEGGDALGADGVETTGGVFLRDVTASGEVRLLGAKIGVFLDCTGGRFTNEGGKALGADGATIDGTWFWRGGSVAKGRIDFTAAKIGAVDDDPSDWPAPGDLVLDRMTYGAFTGRGISATERLRWLGLQDPARFGQDFWPQPWEECARVLREMGHREDAREVLIDKERRQRADRRRRIEVARAAARVRRDLAAAPAEGRQAVLDAANPLCEQAEGWKAGRYDLAAQADRWSPRDAVLFKSRVARSPFVRERDVVEHYSDFFKDKTLEEQNKARAAHANATDLVLRDPPLDRPIDRVQVVSRMQVIAYSTRLNAAAFWDGVLSATIDYGQRPLKAGWPLLFLWLLSTVIFASAWRADAMKPNNPFILRAPEWVACGVQPGEAIRLEGAAHANLASAPLTKPGSPVSKAPRGAPPSPISTPGSTPPTCSFRWWRSSSRRTGSRMRTDRWVLPPRSPCTSPS